MPSRTSPTYDFVMDTMERVVTWADSKFTGVVDHVRSRACEEIIDAATVLSTHLGEGRLVLLSSIDTEDGRGHTIFEGRRAGNFIVRETFMPRKPHVPFSREHRFRVKPENSWKFIGETIDLTIENAPVETIGVLRARSLARAMKKSASLV